MNLISLSDKEIEKIIKYSTDLEQLEEKLVMIRDNIAKIRMEFNDFTNELIFSKGGDPRNKYQIDIETGRMILHQKSTIELPFLANIEMDEV